MADNSEVKILQEKKEAYIRQVKEKGEMTFADANVLRKFDYQIFMAKHPLIKKFNKWLNPEIPAQGDKKTNRKNILKRVARFAVTFPVAIPHNLFLNTAASYWMNKNIMKYDPNRKNKKSLLLKKLVASLGAPVLLAEEELKNANIAAATRASSGVFGMLAAEALENKTSVKPIDPALKARLRGLGDKPQAPVHQTKIDSRVAVNAARNVLDK